MAEPIDDESIAHGPQKHPAQAEAARRGQYFAQAIRAAVTSGRRADIVALFENRVGWTAIQHWCAGRRGVPQWAYDCVMAKGRAIVDPLARVPIGPGSIVGKYNLPSIKEKARLQGGLDSLPLVGKR